VPIPEKWGRSKIVPTSDKFASTFPYCGLGRGVVGSEGFFQFPFTHALVSSDGFVPMLMVPLWNSIKTLKLYPFCHIYCAHLCTRVHAIFTASCTVSNRESRYPPRLDLWNCPGLRQARTDTSKVRVRECIRDHHGKESRALGGYWDLARLLGGSC